MQIRGSRNRSSVAIIDIGFVHNYEGTVNSNLTKISNALSLSNNIQLQVCCEGTLDASYVSWREDVFAVGVILASRGYPMSSSKGQVITGTDNISRRRDHYVFHCGTAVSEGDLVTNGNCVHSKVTILQRMFRKRYM